jgi:hypothetical protein
MPLFGVLVGSSMVADWSEETWRCRSALWIALGLGVPLVCALVHTRRPGILGLTLLVGMTTYPAFRHLVVGPRSADTTVVTIGCQVHERHGTRCIEQRLRLGDGRAVFIEAPRAARVREGDPARVTTLDDVVLRLDER